MPANAPSIVRGRIVVPALGAGRYFMFNPSKIRDDKATEYGAINIPGASHPVQQYGSGGERTISFDLYLDGDRGRFGRQQARDTSSMSIQDELAFFRALEYPVQFAGDFTQVSPYTILFTFGTLYQSVPCIVKKVSWDIGYWVPNPDGQLVPVRATVPITLAEIPPASVSVSDFLNALVP